MSIIGVIKEALVASAASIHTRTKATTHRSHMWRAPIAQPVFSFSRSLPRVLFLSPFSHSQRHSSPPTSHHPQSHSRVLSMSLAQILPFDLFVFFKRKTKKVDKKGTPTVLSAHAKEIAVLWWQSINTWGRGRLTVTSAAHCGQTGASSQESGRDVNCRRDF